MKLDLTVCNSPSFPCRYIRVWEEERGAGTEVQREAESEKEVGERASWLELEM